MNSTQNSQLYSVFSYLDLIQFVLGSFFNFLVIATCCRKKLRKNSMFVFVAFISVSNLVQLFFGSSVRFYVHISGLDQNPLDWTLCKFNTFINFVSFQWISWFFMFVSVDLYLVVYYQNFRQKYLTFGRIIILCATISVIICLLNIPIFMATDHRWDYSGTYSDFMVVCHASFSSPKSYTRVIMIVI